jgi:hypothetical protein
VRIVANEGIERQIVEALRTEGYPVVYFGEEAPGSADLDVLALARESEVLLLTSDKDFGELVFRQRLASANDTEPQPLSLAFALREDSVRIITEGVNQSGRGRTGNTWLASQFAPPPPSGSLRPPRLTAPGYRLAFSIAREPPSG